MARLAAPLIVQAGLRWRVRSLATGRQDPILQAAAEAHARYQADRGVQGHQLWDRRYRELARRLPAYTGFREIANESWPGQAEVAAASEMYRSWRLSRGHWSTINGPCDIWGLAMAFNARKKVWYACGIFADRRTRSWIQSLLFGTPTK